MFGRVVAAIAMALLLVSCADNAPTPAPVEAPFEATTVALHFTAGAGLNPGVSGLAAPVRVRIFELKNTANFARADYFALVERTQSTLGADLLDQDELLLQPGEQLTVDRGPHSAARHIGLAVGFREIDQAQWRAVLTVAPHQASDFHIAVDARAISGVPAANPNRHH